MSSDYSEPDEGGAQMPSGAEGKLVVELPHLAATVAVYDNSLMPVGVGPVKPDAQVPNQCLLEVDLKPGVYAVEVTLADKSERQHAIVRPGELFLIKRQQWGLMALPSAAPLAETATASELHVATAEEWSHKLTWAQAPGGESRLFIFVRTLEPKKYPRFTQGLQLLSADGEPLVELSGTAVAEDLKKGWMAFNAELPAGYYVLRRGRSGVRLRLQPVYLCPGWQTQVFIAAHKTPSLRTMTVNMARIEKGFSANDETALAAEAVLDSLRYSRGANPVIANEKIHTLVKYERENAWLGIIAAYALRNRRDPRRETTPDAGETAETLSSVMDFLKEVGSHPDVKALFLDDDTPAPEPFLYPPMLRAGLKMVQHHATRFASTIPRDSLTDCVLDNLVGNSLWTAWRHLDELPDFGQRQDAAAQNVFAGKTTKSMTRASAPRDSVRAISKDAGQGARRRSRGGDKPYTSAFLQAASPSLPIYRLESDSKTDGAAETVSQAPDTYAAPATVATVFSTLLIQIADRLMSGEGDETADRITIDYTKQLFDLLKDVTPDEVSAASGLPLSRTIEGLELLKQECANAPKNLDWSVLAETTLGPAEQAVFEYAVQRAAQRKRASWRQASGYTQSSPGSDGAAQSPVSSLIGRAQPVTIEECMCILTEEANRLSSVQGAYKAQANELADMLRALADAMHRRADFLVLTDSKGHMLYGNGAFVRMLKLSGKENRAQEKLRRIWEAALAAVPPGRSILPDPNQMDHRFWELRRIAVADEINKNIQAYLSIFRIAGAPRLTEGTIREVKNFLPELTLYSSFFALGGSERKDEYLQKVKALIKSLEQVSTDSFH